MLPKVSVLMSVFNGEPYLREAIESILNQTFTDFEFIIIDDCSGDSTSAILAEYSSRDPRLIIIRNDQNIGLTRSLNKGLALARGEYIARQDADDLSSKERLKRQVKFLDDHPQVILVSSCYELIDAQGNHLKTIQLNGEPDIIAWYLLFLNYISGHSVVMFKHRPVRELGGYAEEYYYAQDYELWLRLVNVGDMAILPDILLQWRQHEQNVSVTRLSNQIEYALKASRHHLNQLTNREFDLAQVSELRNFWLGLPFRNPQVDGLLTNLKIIYSAFLAHRAERNYNNLALSRQIRFLISKNLLYSARSSSLFETLWFKMMLLPHALAWHPLAVLDYWSKIPGKLLQQILHPRV